MQITAILAAQVRHAFAFDAETSASLRAGWDGDLGALAVDGRNFHLAAEGCLHHRCGRAAIEIGAVALKERVRFHGEEEIKIAGRAAAHAAIAFAGQADAGAVFNAGRDFYRERTFFLHLASAATGAAWRFDGLTAAMAGRAGAHHAEHALLRADLAGALAGGAGFQRRVAFGARALARLARLRARHDDLALIAAESLFERDLD